MNYPASAEVTVVGISEHLQWSKKLLGKRASIVMSQQHMTNKQYGMNIKTLLVDCLLGELCSGQTPHWPQGFSVELRLRLGSTHRREHVRLPCVPDMGE